MYVWTEGAFYATVDGRRAYIQRASLQDEKLRYVGYIEGDRFEWNELGAASTGKSADYLTTGALSITEVGQAIAHEQARARAWETLTLVVGMAVGISKIIGEPFDARALEREMQRSSPNAYYSSPERVRALIAHAKELADLP